LREKSERRISVPVITHVRGVSASSGFPAAFRPVAMPVHPPEFDQIIGFMRVSVQPNRTIPYHAGEHRHLADDEHNSYVLALYITAKLYVFENWQI